MGLKRRRHLKKNERVDLKNFAIDPNIFSEFKIETIERLNIIPIKKKKTPFMSQPVNQMTLKFKLNLKMNAALMSYWWSLAQTTLRQPYYQNLK